MLRVKRKRAVFFFGKMFPTGVAYPAPHEVKHVAGEPSDPRCGLCGRVKSRHRGIDGRFDRHTFQPMSRAQIAQSEAAVRCQRTKVSLLPPAKMSSAATAPACVRPMRYPLGLPSQWRNTDVAVNGVSVKPAFHDRSDIIAQQQRPPPQNAAYGFVPREHVHYQCCILCNRPIVDRGSQSAAAFSWLCSVCNAAFIENKRFVEGRNQPKPMPASVELPFQ